MTKDSGDNLDWALKLGCPPSFLTDDVKKILNQGIMNFVWDEAASVIQPVEDVIETRKNILLNSLQNPAQCPAIQTLKKIKSIKKERAFIEFGIDKADKEITAVSNSLEEKGLKLTKLKNEQEKIELKTEVLKLKHKSVEKEIKSCKDLILECNKLMPECKHEIDEDVVNYCLMLAGKVSSREDKYEALKQIHETLGNVAIPELWDILLRKRIQDTEKLTRIQLGEENYEVSRPPVEIWKIGIAKVEAEVISATLEAMFHAKKANENAALGTSLINNIIVNDSEDVLTWIQLNMEVAQQQAKCKTLQSHLEFFKNFNNKMSDLSERESELMSEIYNISLQLDDHVTATRISLSSVKSSGQFLLKLRDNITEELTKIAVLNSQKNFQCIGGATLISEVQEFHKNTDVNALNKIMLLDKVGAYRHSSTCMSNILLVTPNLTSITPVFNSPLYNLITCFKNLMTNKLLKEKLAQKNLQYSNPLMISVKNPSLDSSKDNDIFETLDKIKHKNAICKREIENLETLYNVWATQPVQEAMSVVDDTVNRLTYDEWMKRFSSLLYMITRNK